MMTGLPAMDNQLDTAPCGFVSLAGDGTIVAANTTLAQFLGTTRDALQGRHFETLLPVGGRLFYQTHLFPLLKMSGQVDEIYLVLRSATGEEVPMLVNGARRDQAGVITYDCILVPMRQRDRYEDELLRARKTAEEAGAQLTQAHQHLQATFQELEQAHTELKNTQAQLIQSEKLRALGQMIAGVAHEINNPTAFVTSNMEYLAEILPALARLFAAYAPLRAAAGPEQDEAIRQIEAELDMDYVWRDLSALVEESREGLRRIRDIVLTLRNFARLDESGMMPADINEGLRSTLQIVRPLAKDRVALVEDYGPLPRVVCRPRELNQVFLNLLTNAIQSIDGPGTVWISTAHQGDTVVITIRDSGSGMDPATLERLGEPFFTTKPVGSGTGLGLSVSFGIVERHGGRLLFASDRGTGTTVTVELPVEHDQQ
jgi:PAS domain S-box-containing protein